MLPETEICCHGQCNQGRACPLHDRVSQKVILLRGREQASPLIQSQRPVCVTADQAQAMDDTLEAFGPPATTGNSLGSLWADVRGFWAALPALIRMRFTRPWYVKEARRRSDAHPDNVTHIDHHQQYLQSQELLQRLQGHNKESK